MWLPLQLFSFQKVLRNLFLKLLNKCKDEKGKLLSFTVYFTFYEVIKAIVILHSYTASSLNMVHSMQKSMLSGEYLSFRELVKVTE